MTKGDTIKSISTMNRSVAQIVSRTGLVKGDKYGVTHGWFLDTSRGRTIVRWTNRYDDNLERSVKRASEALAERGYTVSVRGYTIEVTQ